jgi:hypothetical protein
MVGYLDIGQVAVAYSVVVDTIPLTERLNRTPES